jgi:hypothetical protein
MSPTRAIVSASAARSAPKLPKSLISFLASGFVSRGGSEGEKIFDQFMVEQSLRPAFEQAPAQPRRWPLASRGISPISLD